MKLAEKIESHLLCVYSLEQDLRVSDFLISDEELLDLVPHCDLQNAPKEMFLVKAKPEEDTMEIALFLNEDLKSNLHKIDPLENLCAENISDFCALIEGVSHFVYYVQKANQNQNVSQLELELQAEVDKYVLLSLFLKSESREHHRVLDMLFENYFLHQNLTDEQKHRYQTASDLARKYCFQLSQNLANMDYGTFISDARAFYSLTQAEKIQYILMG